MRAVGIKVLKNKLSHYIRLAKSGERILISDRDRVVAELIPPQMTRSPEVADALLADLIRKGLIQPALYRQGPPPQSPSVGTLDEVLSGLDQDRDDR